MKNYAILFNWKEVAGLGVQVEFAICLDVQEFAKRAVEQGFSVYLGVIEYKWNKYQYVVAFAGLGQLELLQKTGSFYFPEYARDLVNDGLLEDLELCLFDGNDNELRKEI